MEIGRDSKKVVFAGFIVGMVATVLWCVALHCGINTPQVWLLGGYIVANSIVCEIAAIVMLSKWEI